MGPPAAAASVAAVKAGARVAGRSPRFAIVAFSLVAALGLSLGFVYLLVTRPKPIESPLATTGDWMTREQFRAEFSAAITERDRTISPATDAALAKVVGAVDILRAELAARESSRDERAKAILDSIGRVEGRVDALYARSKP